MVADSVMRWKSKAAKRLQKLLLLIHICAYIHTHVYMVLQAEIVKVIIEMFLLNVVICLWLSFYIA